MRPPFLEVLLRTSFADIAPPISFSDTEGSMTIPYGQSGQQIGSPNQSYTKKQQPHDAIFR